MIDELDVEVLHGAQVSLPTQYNGKAQDPVGALSGTLARLQANRPLRELREIAKGVTKQLPEPIQARPLCPHWLTARACRPVCVTQPATPASLLFLS